MAKNLWKNNRTARNEARPDNEQVFPPDDIPEESVGAILKKQREERGEDLRYVAQILRIRYPYLKAIEDGYPDELPGPTYAVGFVRTYADHLGLDSEKLVQQFKAEAAGLQARADLHFPAPLPEGKIPSGAVLVLAVVLAAAVYGAWIYLSSREQQVAEIVPQLPSQISDIIKGQPGTPDAKSPAGSATASAQPAAAAPAPAPMADKPDAAPKAEEASPAETAAPPARSAGAFSSAPARSEAASATSAQPETAGAGERNLAAATPATPATDPIPQPPVASAESAEADVTPAPSPVTASQQTPGSESESPTGVAGLPEAERAPPKVYGEENSPARIVIHAAADSWVEVRDSTTDELLLTRVLFKGDRYRVPDRGGLTLLTGNAGGLRIVVDGEDAPAIGPLGAVRRNVLLDPSALLSGSAVRRVSDGQAPTDSQTSDSSQQAQ